MMKWTQGKENFIFEGGSRRLIFVYFWLVPYGTMLQMVFHHIKCFEITIVIMCTCVDVVARFIFIADYNDF